MGMSAGYVGYDMTFSVQAVFEQKTQKLDTLSMIHHVVSMSHSL